MVEVIYKREQDVSTNTEVNIRLPKNIKQIGDGKPDIQVYIEDSVYLYLAKYPDCDTDIRYGVLLGNVKVSCGYTYIFVYGAVDVREIYDNAVLFSDEIWTGINEDITRFFRGQKVVGWFLSEYTENKSQNAWIKKMHINNFAGLDKVLFRLDREEREESVYYYGTDILEKLSCYHIFYDKNKAMNEYIADGGMDEKLRATGKVYEPVSKEGAVWKNTQKITRNNQEDMPQTIEQMSKEAGVITDEQTENANHNENGIQRAGKSASKVASIMIIGALATVVGVMAKDGKFEQAYDNMKYVVDDIMGNDAHVADENSNDIISVNGVPESSSQAEEEIEQVILDESQNVEENNIESDKNEETTPSEAPQQQTTPVQVTVEPANPQYYTVEKGDTLYSICKKLYGNTSNMEEIIRLNDLSGPDAIYYGEDIIVP